MISQCFILEWGKFISNLKKILKKLYSLPSWVFKLNVNVMEFIHHQNVYF